MAVKKTDDRFLFSDEAPAKVTLMGNITDLTVSSSAATAPPCKKVSKDSYVDTRTGEVRDYHHIRNRAQSFDSVRKTMRKIRELINANVTKPENIRWITLTYRENMIDSKQLYSDFEKFWKRLLYYFGENSIPKPEYITVVEPQGRGAWHVHGILIWQQKAPYIANDVLASIWGHGFVNIKQPNNCDNLGAYFSAYLSNMPLDEIEQLPEEEQTKTYAAAASTGSITPVNVVTEDGASKKIVKGARLAMYPPGMNIVRRSRGTIKPETIKTTYGEAMEYLADAEETYHQEYAVIGAEGQQVGRILKASYNKRKTINKAHKGG